MSLYTHELYNDRKAKVARYCWKQTSDVPICNVLQSAQRRIRAMVAQASAPGRRRAAQPPPAAQ